MKYEREALYYKGRYLRTQAGKLLFGPAGKRLFVDYLDKTPGFSGRIDFIHKINLTELFRVTTDREFLWEEAESVWYPDHLFMQYEDESLSFYEEKFITWEDQAVSYQRWTNHSKEPMRLSLQVKPKQCSITWENAVCHVHTPMTRHGYEVFYYVGSTDFEEGNVLWVEPGQTRELIVAAAFGNAQTESKEKVCENLLKYLKAHKNKNAYLEAHKKQYGSFYEMVPSFSCSDKMIEKAWNYRWYLLKNTYAEPAFGNFKHGVMFEGRSHKMGKKPFVSEGWEFTKLIPLSTPLQLTDLKWSGHKEMGKEMIRSLLDSQSEDGMFRVMMADEFGNGYANYGVWAIYRFLLQMGETEFAGEILERMKAFVSANERQHGMGNDHLQVEQVHQLTGKEYQPSYWYFSNTYTWLKRVDRSVYHYLNLRGLAGLCRLCKDKEEERYEQKADFLKKEINDMMWDEETKFYYDLHYQTLEKAYVKNVVGFYPLWADICGEKQFAMLSAIQNPEEFATEGDFPSVARNCPDYTAAGGFQKQFIKGRDGCVWCGPSWPYTNGIMVDMLGIATKKRNHSLDRLFAQRLYRYTREHFRDYDKGRPYLVEHYNPETGELLSDEVDYNHSFYIQLIMEHVVGITVTEDGVFLDPVDVGLAWFASGEIEIQGHSIEVSYRKGEYYRAFVDGKQTVDLKTLGKARLF